MAEKEQNKTRFGVSDRGVPNEIGMPDTVGPEVTNKRIRITSMPEPSLGETAERMGAAKPWVPKGGHSSADANDPGNDTPSMRFKPAPSEGYVVVKSPKDADPGGKTGPTQTPAGQADAGGYTGASGVGGYS